MPRGTIPTLEFYLFIDGRQTRKSVHYGEFLQRADVARKYIAMRNDLRAQGVQVSGPEIIERVQ